LAHLSCVELSGGFEDFGELQEYGLTSKVDKRPMVPDDEDNVPELTGDV